MVMIKWLVILQLLLSLLCCQPKSDQPIQKNGRQFGIEVSEGENEDYETLFNEVKSIGIDFTHVSIGWTLLEPGPNTLQDTNNLLRIIDHFYPSRNTPIYFTLQAPLNTAIRDIPDDIKPLDLDDPTLITRFKALLDFMIPRLSNTQFVAFIIGNEVDIYLESQPQEFEAFKTFFIAAKAHAQSLRSDLSISFTTTLSGNFSTLGNQIQDLYSQADFISLTYYPLNDDFTPQAPSTVIPQDFQRITNLYKKDIYFQEFGFPTSPQLNSSQSLQSQFITELFKAWDQHPTQIKLLCQYILTDSSQEFVDSYIAEQNLTHIPNISAFLKTLGLRTYQGKEKEAYGTLRNAIEERGW